MKLSITTLSVATLLLTEIFFGVCDAFAPNRFNVNKLLSYKSSTSSLLVLSARQARFLSAEEIQKMEDAETPAGVDGAQFFGGNKIKGEVFYADAKAADQEIQVDQEIQMYDRFADTNVFVGTGVGEIASCLQSQINAILYYEDSSKAMSGISYSPNLRWETPLTVSTKNPLLELDVALNFYRRVDVAIIAGERLSADKIQLRWEISLQWPLFWQARVLLTGTSELTMDNNNDDESKIIQQVDKLEGKNDILDVIRPQISPRFWDIVALGMTPSAEMRPRLNIQRKLSYTVFETPPYLAVVPTQWDIGTREDRNAQIVPNHAFSAEAIKTLGPNRQRFVPASPVEVAIIPGQENLLIKWHVPMAVEFQSLPMLPMAREDPEANPECNPQTRYELIPRRLAATTRTSNDPQDEEISDIRKQLYEKIMKDGFKPKLDESGRPQFFYVQNGVKVCYTNEGLGMCTYEPRPEAAKCHEVGIELEFQ